MADIDAAELASRLDGLPRPLLLGFDVDGTLAPFRDDPADVRIPESIRRVLVDWSRSADVDVALVTGRDATSLHHIGGPVELWRIVEHGSRLLEPGEPATPIALEADDARRLEEFERFARAELTPHGVRLESKERSLGVHVRELAARSPDAARALLERAREASRARGLVHQDGRHLVEVAPHLANKAEALEALMKRLGAASLFYAGDDLTDRPAVALANQHGLGLLDWGHQNLRTFLETQGGQVHGSKPPKEDGFSG